MNLSHNPKSKILLEFSNYEEGISSLFFFATNGIWSGGLTVYMNDDKIVDWYSQLINYDGKEKNKVLLELGKPNGEYAYYVKILAYPVDSLGHSALSFQLIDYHHIYLGKSCEFYINCDPSDINRLGEYMKIVYSKKTPVKWKDSVEWEINTQY